MLGAAQRVAVVHAAPLRGYAAQVEAVLTGSGASVVPIEVPDAEAGKDISVAARCWDILAEAGFTRSDAVVGVGGGAVTDLAGFVAASWLRGVRVVQIATSLLGMVDAAVGGKTGVNIAAGKNLVGAFHPPCGVLCDLDTLATLAPGELAAGMAEIVKAGFIADPVILDRIEADPAAVLDPSGPLLRELVERSIQVKADVVGQDLREAGIREYLNYGHTLAHAVEQLEEYACRHGNAVSIGLVYAAELGVRTGRLDRATADRHRALLAALGLPTGYRPGVWADLRRVMRIDKKTRGSRLRFVVLDGLGKPGILADPDEELLRSAYAAVSGTETA